MTTIACKRWGTDADHCVLHEDHLGPCKPRQAEVPPPPPENEAREDYRNQYPFRLGLLIGAMKLAIIDINCGDAAGARRMLRRALREEEQRNAAYCGKKEVVR
jgi:hypothetical protein